MKPGSQNARLLAVLQDGRWHVSRELHERCGYMRTNSRIAELRDFGRDHGFVIEGESVPGKTGTDGYRYRLVNLSAGPEADRDAGLTPHGFHPQARTANGVSAASLGASQAPSALTRPSRSGSSQVVIARVGAATQLSLTDAA